jgi:multimeric flavodoxin WrbA
MKITAIAGSPLSRGNSSGLLEVALDAARERGHDVRMLSARKLKVQPCTACMGCKRGPKCIVDDDMNQVYAAIARCDALVLATPLYYYGATAWLKAVVDRTYGLLDKDSKSRVPAGKRLYVITTQDAEDPEDGAIVVRQLERSFEWLGMVLSGSLIGTQLSGPTDHQQRPDLLEAARNLLP